MSTRLEWTRLSENQSTARYKNQSRGRLRLYLSFSFLLLRAIANQSATAGDTRRGRAEACFAIVAASTSVRHEESRNRHYKLLREVGGGTRSIRKRYSKRDACNRAFESLVATNIQIAAFVHFKRDKRIVSVIAKFCSPIN